MGQCYGEKTVYKGSMGYLVDGLNDIKYKDARLAFTLWIKDFLILDGVQADITYYENVDEMLEDYINNKFNYMAVNPYFLLKHKDIFYDNTKNFWMVQRSSELFEEYIILVRDDGKINTIKDLKAKIIMSRSDDYMGRMVVDFEILKEAHTTAKNYFSDMEKTEKFSTSILKTYFSKVDACIVPSYVFAVVSEMNPDISKKLKVLHKSEKIFLSLVGGFHNNTTEEMLDIFSLNMARNNSSARGQNIMSLFKMKKILPLAQRDLKPLFEYYDAYMVLKQKYEVKMD
ncbi:PhnD/SsuA/transferrin family substrate-binding protein [Candidatus Sulfurimonas marisnigri]|uniref:PhnD/SsuA/transferrin family substrate-binding protein n=1 Tax=Candidatus Sulfurimonas marisnigri TaxID=2740405 RepID=A0A7S7M0W8_9BACT|nr:PhnD/SsuA/transferrin family substrate-binding protein [Candidatus Sulfurimonas marisnigri]QOY54214.1 PhnD/SsuA/transferrin family substrate-binding protein [Candidatus Sulfurimonas marisnigri]